jgi:putative exosortase-associated protein (TIGR04073 family)
MKTLLITAVLFRFVTPLLADIQDPPSNDYGPTRKLGRGLSNICFGISELPVTIARINETDGNSAAGGYGLVRGLGRSGMRIQSGLLELFTFPFASRTQRYYPILLTDFSSISGGYQEFPPELGNESKYPYVRKY